MTRLGVIVPLERFTVSELLRLRERALHEEQHELDERRKRALLDFAYAAFHLAETHGEDDSASRPSAA